MFQKLVSRNDDLRRLVEKGYAITFDTNCLIARDIPYLDSTGALKVGAIVTKLEFIDKERVKQVDHTIFFAGGVPHQMDGTAIQNLGGGSASFALSEACKDVVVERSFSNKPRATGKFEDFFEKIESYVRIISGPAMERYGATCLTFRVVEEIIPDAIFKFHDTMTSRAEITDIAAKFNSDVAAVIGLGGSGAYLLDFLVKTPVKEVRAFDLDPFHVHNAFRSPGRLDESELGKTKAEVYRARYENFRNGLLIQPKLIHAASVEELEGVTFAFVCVDKGSSRAGVFDLLISKRIPFIDVGMGLYRERETLNGLMRMTYYPVEHAQTIRDKNLAPLIDSPDDVYRANIQIGELNALNAALAIIRFKQLRGFYAQELSPYHILFGLGDLKIAGDTDLT